MFENNSDIQFNLLKTNNIKAGLGFGDTKGLAL
jgi:hypothetical protein